MLNFDEQLLGQHEALQGVAAIGLRLGVFCAEHPE